MYLFNCILFNTANAVISTASFYSAYQVLKLF